jgi:pimeloyl-ACP methyl ester carboxylesterase
MSGERKRGLWCEQVPVKLRQNGSSAEVLVPVYRRPSTQEVKSLWVLGFGAGSMAVRNVIEAQNDYGLAGAAVVLPYHKVPYEHMEGFTNEAVPKVVEAVAKSKYVTLGGDSRGAGAAIRGAGNAPELIKAAGFLEPAFLTTMGDNPDESLKQLLLRLGVNLPRLRNPFHPGVLQTGLGIVKELSYLQATQGSAKLRKAVELVTDPGVVERTVTSLGKLVDAQVPVRIWAGERDPVFPPAEIKATLKHGGLDSLVVPTWDGDVPHVAMGSPEGFEQALMVADFLSDPSYVPFPPKS